MAELCSKLGVESFRDIKEPTKHCNSESGNCITYGGQKKYQKLENIKEDYDTAIIFLGSVSYEGDDRPSLGFDQGVHQMVSQFGNNGKSKGKKTIVVMSVPGSVNIPWRDDVDAIILDIFSGEQMA